MNTVPDALAAGLRPELRWTTMGEIAEVVGGGTPHTSDPTNFDGGEIPWLTPADLSGYVGKYASRGARSITAKGLQSSSARLLPAGAVLFTSRAPVGYVVIAANAIATNQGFKSFVLKPGMLPEYVYWWLKGAKRIAEALASGTTFLEISGANAKKIPIPIVRIDEQRRIVAEIEKQFSRLDEAVANLQRVKANLKRYQAGVLSVATQGWPVVPLRSLLREPLRNGHSAKGTDDPKGLRAFTLTAVTKGDFSEGNTKLTLADARRVADLWAQPGDIYVERSNTPDLVGTARLYRGPANFAFIPDLLIRVRVSDLVLAAYAEIALASEAGRQFLKGRAQGISGTMPKIDQSAVECFPMPLPPLPDQRRIVAEVDRRLSIVREVEAEVNANLKRAQALRQAVLHSAFSQ